MYFMIPMYFVETTYNFNFYLCILETTYNFLFYLCIFRDNVF